MSDPPTRSAPSPALRRLARTVLPGRARRWLWTRSRRVWPPMGLVRFGDLRRLKPIGKAFGVARGTPVDRFYIERFLGSRAGDIRGAVLEIGGDDYARRFGRLPDEGEGRDGLAGRVTRVDVLHADATNPEATLIADLADAPHLHADTFDCVILTQTLQYIYDIRGALRTLHRILAPGGVVLVTVPGITQISREDCDQWGEYWRFTTYSLLRLLQDAFPGGQVHVEAHGNVLTSIALLHGLVVEDLRESEFEVDDPDYELLVTARAVKPARNRQPDDLPAH